MTGPPEELLARDWRARRRQLDLACEVDVSPRLSFVEAGRSQARPELLLALPEPLDISPGAQRHPAGRRLCSRRQDFCFLGLEFLVANDAPVFQVRQLGQLVGSPFFRGHALDVTRECLLLSMGLLRRPLMH